MARALCATRKILLLDEPVTGLDPVVSGNMYRIIRDLREEKKITIVMVSHDVEGAVREARKRYSMIRDGLSHVGFAALACAYPFGFSPLYISIPVCVAAAFFLLQLKESSRIKGDAATALMCSGALAVGVMVISLTTGMNTDVCNYLFGSILAMSSSDLYLSIVLSIAVLALYVLFFNRIFAVTFDETFAGATGVNVRLYNMVIAILTAVTVVLGMQEHC